MAAYGRARLWGGLGILVLGVLLAALDQWEPDPARVKSIAASIILIGVLSLGEQIMAGRRFRKQLLSHPLVMEGKARIASQAFARVGRQRAAGCLILADDAWVFCLLPQRRNGGEWNTLFSLPLERVAQVECLRAIHGVSGPELVLSGDSVANVYLTMDRPAMFAKAFAKLKDGAA